MLVKGWPIRQALLTLAYVIMYTNACNVSYAFSQFWVIIIFDLVQDVTAW